MGGNKRCGSCVDFTKVGDPADRCGKCVAGRGPQGCFSSSRVARDHHQLRVNLKQQAAKGRRR